MWADIGVCRVTLPLKWGLCGRPFKQQHPPTYRRQNRRKNPHVRQLPQQQRRVPKLHPRWNRPRSLRIVRPVHRPCRQQGVLPPTPRPLCMLSWWAFKLHAAANVMRWPAKWMKLKKAKLRWTKKPVHPGLCKQAIAPKQNQSKMCPLPVCSIIASWSKRKLKIDAKKPVCLICWGPANAPMHGPENMTLAPRQNVPTTINVPVTAMNINA